MSTVTAVTATEKWTVRFNGGLVRGKTGSIIYLHDKGSAETWLDKSGLDKQCAEIVLIKTRSSYNNEQHGVLESSPDIRPGFNQTRVEDTGEIGKQAKHMRKTARGYTVIMLDENNKNGFVRCVFGKSSTDVSLLAELKFNKPVIAVIDMQVPSNKISAFKY